MIYLTGHTKMGKEQWASFGLRFPSSVGIVRPIPTLNAKHSLFPETIFPGELPP